MPETRREPALTAEEWKAPVIRRLRRAGFDRHVEMRAGDDGFNDVRLSVTSQNVLDPGVHLTEVVVLPEERHALAALALYGQPFGFTHEELDELLATDPDMLEFEDRLARILAKIRALLPPK